MSCKNGSLVDNTESDKLSVILDKVAITSDSIVNDVKYVPLEITDNSLIETIIKVLYRNDKFYIFNRSQNTNVLVFDKSGKFLFSIGKKGEGPDEYIEPVDMDVDNVGNVYIADNARQQILKFKEGTTEVSEIIKIGEYFAGFACIDDEHILLNDVREVGKAKAKLALYSLQSKTMTILLESVFPEVNDLSLMHVSKHYIYRSGDKLNYYRRLSPELYSINEDGSPKVFMTIVSDKFATPDILKKMENNPREFIHETTHIKDITTIYELDDYYICNPYVAPSSNYLLIPKKNPNKAFLFDQLSDKRLNMTTWIEAVADNSLVCLMNYSEEAVVAHKDRPELKDWNENSNPVLVLFTLRSNIPE